MESLKIFTCWPGLPILLNKKKYKLKGGKKNWRTKWAWWGDWVSWINTHEMALPNSKEQALECSLHPDKFRRPAGIAWERRPDCIHLPPPLPTGKVHKPPSPFTPAKARVLLQLSLFLLDSLLPYLSPIMHRDPLKPMSDHFSAPNLQWLLISVRIKSRISTLKPGSYHYPTPTRITLPAGPGYRWVPLCGPRVLKHTRHSSTQGCALSASCLKYLLQISHSHNFFPSRLCSQKSSLPGILHSPGHCNFLAEHLASSSYRMSMYLFCSNKKH